MKTLRDIQASDLSSEVVILRVDLNVEDTHDSWRREAIIPTLKWLLSRNARVLMISHRGRPTPTDNAASAAGNSSVTLRGNVAPLARMLGRAVMFIDHFRFAEIRDALRAAPAGSVYLMENIRLLMGEETNSAPLAKTLASLGTLYINDAFAVSHRKHASVVAITRYLPSYGGLLMERECGTLREMISKAAHPFVVIIGGIKAQDKMPVISRFLPRADTFLFGGSIANTILKATGTDIGDSVCDPEFIALGKRLAKNRKVVVMRDWLWDKNKILDIGPETIADFTAHIKTAKTVLWNGPLGLVEHTRYANGSVAIAEAIAKSKAFSVVGGGETTQLIRSLGLQKKISLLSTGGGAMLAFLAGKNLPGIEALK
ncbi:MAG: phosphoglycerate kinase [bacterium]|nr:phosphoglycerate kinase [bacterium]